MGVLTFNLTLNASNTTGIIILPSASELWKNSIKVVYHIFVYVCRARVNRRKNKKDTD